MKFPSFTPGKLSPGLLTSLTAHCPRAPERLQPLGGWIPGWGEGPRRARVTQRWELTLEGPLGPACAGGASVITSHLRDPWQDELSPESKRLF